MSKKLYSKILIDRSEYDKLKAIEKQMKLLDEEKKSQLKIVPDLNKNESVEENIEQKGDGDINSMHQSSSQSFLTDEIIQKISNAVTKQLRQKL